MAMRGAPPAWVLLVALDEEDLRTDSLRSTEGVGFHLGARRLHFPASFLSMTETVVL
jgi:hypothetical protein